MIGSAQEARAAIIVTAIESVGADSFTLQIGPAVPEPAIAVLAVLVLAAFAVRRRVTR